MSFHLTCSYDGRPTAATKNADAYAGHVWANAPSWGPGHDALTTSWYAGRPNGQPAANDGRTGRLPHVAAPTAATAAAATTTATTTSRHDEQ